MADHGCSLIALSPCREFRDRGVKVVGVTSALEAMDHASTGRGPMGQQVVQPALTAL